LPEDIRFQIRYRLFFRSVSKSSIEHPSTPGAPWLALTLRYASHTSRFEISNGFPGDFGSPTRSLPESSGCSNELPTNGPAPSLPLHYRDFSTTMGRFECQPRDGTQRLTVHSRLTCSLSPPFQPAAVSG